MMMISILLISSITGSIDKERVNKKIKMKDCFRAPISLREEKEIALLL
jgi:hypothetical protein